MKENQNRPEKKKDKTGSDPLLNKNNIFPVGLAHDFNNMMAVIKLYAQLGLRNPSINDEMKENLNIILDQAAMAKRLIDQMTDVGRPTSPDEFHHCK